LGVEYYFLQGSLRWGKIVAIGSVGLRVRKKERTRIAIQTAALRLFAEQGYESTTVDVIAALAEVSTSTFFRYFASKDDVVFSDRHFKLPALSQAIADAPRDALDLDVVQAAICEVWRGNEVPMLVARAVMNSAVLRGKGVEVVMEWQQTIAHALAQRHGLAPDDRRCHLTAVIAMATFSEVVTAWTVGDRTQTLEERIEEAFALLPSLCAQRATGPQFETRSGGPGAG
jgi:AcrR family transcriptional regulator